ncbi:hypothetical protein F0562_027031 [Nyssa sinensis]|uniref:Uncharacterized protein n=1 Tax=Nyssa sinensis TaxID=561372 RepID=A0A5J5B628_9ASTE|nr:hypothetical protein F0562_027031 [Nyssa sinensis]
MTTSKRLADRKVARFQKNITRRGSVPETVTKKGYDYPVGPIVLGIFVFVVIGSCMPLDPGDILHLAYAAMPILLFVTYLHLLPYHDAFFFGKIVTWSFMACFLMSNYCQLYAAVVP